MDETLANVALKDEASFVARGLLVHRYRAVVLRDAWLPAAAPPKTGRGRARALFAGLYFRLSPGADSLVSACFEDIEGHLPADTVATRQRVRTLRAAAA